MASERAIKFCDECRATPGELHNASCPSLSANLDDAHDAAKVTHSNALIVSMADTFARCLEIAQRKNLDYAAGDDPFANFRASELVGVDPRRAILVRMSDKLARLGNLIDAYPAVASESFGDSCDDLVNYAAILRALAETCRPR